MFELINAYYDNKFIEDYYVDLSLLIEMRISSTQKEFPETSLSLLGTYRIFIESLVKGAMNKLINENHESIDIADMSKEQLEIAIRYYFFIQKLTTIELRKAALMALFQKQWSDVIEQHNVYYRSSLVELEFISSLSHYHRILSNIIKDSLMFRGHESASYKLSPSIFRTNQYIVHEDQMYQEMVATCPEDFSSDASLLEHLVKMQHYGFPTRLLDLTSNPLVALYFACLGNQGGVGEVLVFDLEDSPMSYIDSTQVVILTSLTTLNYHEKQSIVNSFDKSDYEFQKSLEPLYRKIQKNCPLFKHELTKSDIQTTIPVLAPKNNKRIIKQSGAFLLFGLEKKPGAFQHTLLSRKRYLIPLREKKGLLKELDVVSINQASLFPEIDQVAEYVKKKYLRR